MCVWKKEEEKRTRESNKLTQFREKAAKKLDKSFLQPMLTGRVRRGDERQRGNGSVAELRAGCAAVQHASAEMHEYTIVNGQKGYKKNCSQCISSPARKHIMYTLRHYI